MGILLALQINEWSHERKERVLEKTYYCKLSEDIKQDDNQIKQQLIDSEIRIKFSNEMIHLLQQE